MNKRFLKFLAYAVLVELILLVASWQYVFYVGVHAATLVPLLLHLPSSLLLIMVTSLTGNLPVDILDFIFIPMTLLLQVIVIAKILEKLSNFIQQKRNRQNTNAA